MNLRLIPITGVTLTLLSYGGSSLIAKMILLGFVNAIRKGTRKKEEILEIR
jgi:cell division protein FtsW (lipid II flippase)